MDELDIMSLPVDIIENNFDYSANEETVDVNLLDDHNLLLENMVTIPTEPELMEVSMSDVDAANVASEEILVNQGNIAQEVVGNIEEINYEDLEEINDEISKESHDETSKKINNETLDEETPTDTIEDQANSLELRNTPEATHNTMPVSDVDSDESIIVPEKKRKKHNSKNLKKNINKKLRMTGKQYLGYRRDRSGKVFQDSYKEERKMGDACNSKICQKSTIRFCQSLDEEERRQIFDQFWSSMNWDQRKVYLSNMVEKTVVKRRSKKPHCEVNELEEDESDENELIQDKNYKRNSTLKYHLMHDSKKLQVCQKMFLNTLGIKKWTVRYWISGDKQPNKDPVEEANCSGMSLQGTLTRKTTAGITKKALGLEFVQKFFSSLAKLPSHYCRKTTTRLYLEPVFSSMAQLYKIYLERCNEENIETGKEKNTEILSRYSFEKAFKDANLSLYQPKKDKCDLCSAYEVNNVTEEEYRRHTELKLEARSQKEADKKKAKQKELHVFTSDLEAVKVAPYVKASALYYKTKLNVHNFTMYNLETKEATCFWFDETNADLEASVFATCVVSKIKQVVTKEKRPVVLWSDGCGYQNRNAIYSNALLHLAVELDVEIEQKFLIKGHTQMECDSVHSNIECYLKNKDIHLPSQYHLATKESRRNPFPYESLYLTHTFFKNFSGKGVMTYDSIRPGNKVGDPTVHDIRAILYKPEGKIQVKLDFKQENYQDLPRRPKKIIPERVFPELYTQRLAIPRRKWKDLQDLKSVLPQDCHSYYDNLPYKDADDKE